MERNWFPTHESWPSVDKYKGHKSWSADTWCIVLKTTKKVVANLNDKNRHSGNEVNFTSCIDRGSRQTVSCWLCLTFCWCSAVLPLMLLSESALGLWCVPDWLTDCWMNEWMNDWMGCSATTTIHPLWRYACALVSFVVKTTCLSLSPSLSLQCVSILVVTSDFCRSWVGRQVWIEMEQQPSAKRQLFASRIEVIMN